MLPTPMKTANEYPINNLLNTAKLVSRLLGLFLGFAFIPGCGNKAVEKALESDSNGYLCSACKVKFYTVRKVFADVCPQCKSYEIATVVGFVCPKDNHTTLAARGRGATACEKCGARTSALRMPTESDFRAWGASKKSKAEVSQN